MLDSEPVHGPAANRLIGALWSLHRRKKDGEGKQHALHKHVHKPSTGIDANSVERSNGEERRGEQWSDGVGRNG